MNDRWFEISDPLAGSEQRELGDVRNKKNPKRFRRQIYSVCRSLSVMQRSTFFSFFVFIFADDLDFFVYITTMCVNPPLIVIQHVFQTKTSRSSTSFFLEVGTCWNLPQPGHSSVDRGGFSLEIQHDPTYTIFPIKKCSRRMCAEVEAPVR